MPDAVNPGENVLVRHNSTLGIKTVGLNGFAVVGASLAR